MLFLYPKNAFGIVTSQKPHGQHIKKNELSFIFDGDRCNLYHLVTLGAKNSEITCAIRWNLCTQMFLTTMMFAINLYFQLLRDR